MKLLNVDTNAKTVKGQKRGYLTGVLYLAPADLSGFEVCPMRSAGCTAACLNTAGRGAFSNVQEARIRKTRWYFDDRPAFMVQLVKEIAALVRKAGRDGMVPVVRLNGTSDIAWERVPVKWWPDPEQGTDADGSVTLPNVFKLFPDVQFYDYTKVTKRAVAHARGEMPANYHLTFSLTEENDAAAEQVLDAGGNVAAVFSTVPSDWDLDGRMCPAVRVIDGDADDLRFSDPRGVIVGLKAKGKARKDTSGFVRA